MKKFLLTLSTWYSILGSPIWDLVRKSLVQPQIDYIYYFFIHIYVRKRLKIEKKKAWIEIKKRDKTMQ